MEQFKLLPVYHCHKQVRAAKITGVYPFHEGGATLYFDLPVIDGEGQVETKVTDEWLAKHMPGTAMNSLTDGYFVVYEDGHTSWSPAEAFENGYEVEVS